MVRFLITLHFLIERSNNNKNDVFGFVGNLMMRIGTNRKVKVYTDFAITAWVLFVKQEIMKDINI